MSTTVSQRGQAAWRNLAADLCLWFAFLLSLQVFRFVLIGLFRTELAPETGLSDFLQCARLGLRYDISVATYATLPTFLLTLVSWFRPLGAWPRRVRWSLAAAMTVVNLLTFGIDVGYVSEYHDQFNHWVFGLLFDDRTAIALTVWKSYPVLWLAALAVVLIAVSLLAGRTLWRTVAPWLTRSPASWVDGPGRFAIVLVLIGLIVLGLRGSVGRRPIQLKDAAVTADPFLNKFVLNPFSAFRYAVKHQRLLSKAAGLREVLPDGDVQAAVRAVFPHAGTVTNLDDCLRRAALGRPGLQPQHVILLVEESYDAWGLRPENAALRATERLGALSKAGIAADAFVSAADGTMPSLGALITGLPYTHAQANYQPTARYPFPTSVAPIFKRLGFRTRFFYSGYLSWQRLGDFCREQGFDEVHGGPGMSERLTGNEWGVDDERLFEFVLERLGEQPSFDMIMTTSYHPPYSVDLEAQGFPQQAIQSELDARGFSALETRILGHLWYADHALGDFAEAVVRQSPRALLAITGDHWSRRIFSRRPSLFGTRAVPFVLYGPEVLRDIPRPARIAGSHNDVIPTLVELCAPKGFEYHAFGRNMLDPALPQIGYGNRAVVTPEYVLDVVAHGAVQDLDGQRADGRVPAEEWARFYRQFHALAWWRLVKGSGL